MIALISPVPAIRTVISALRYELARLCGVRSMRAVVLWMLAGSVLLTLPAARQMVGLMRPSPPHARSARIGPLVGQLDLSHALSHAYGFVWQYAPMPGDGSWVVASGVVGMVLPGIAAALGAAWFGATSIGYEYRDGSGLLTFALMPRRGSVLVAKIIVAAVFGALLSFGTTAVAYGTAWLGFRLAGMQAQVSLPAALLAPGLREIAMAALGGALGVFVGVVLRVRALAMVLALAGCALVAAFLSGASSPAVPYLAEAVRYIVRTVPTLTYDTASSLLLGVPLAVLALAGMIAVRRRRVV